MKCEFCNNVASRVLIVRGFKTFFYFFRREIRVKFNVCIRHSRSKVKGEIL